MTDVYDELSLMDASETLDREKVEYRTRIDGFSLKSFGRRITS